MKIVFMGSPQFSLPSLQALSEQHTIAAVVCQPDRPAGRGKATTAPVTKAFAVELGIPVLQPERIQDADVVSEIQTFEAELLVVAAYGQILPQSLLDLPARGSLNVHASLLPRWRGAAPVQAAIRNGDTESGVTIMRMDAGLDTGPIISQRKVRIEAEATGGSLTHHLSHVGAELLLATLPGYLSGELSPTPQDEALATYAPMLKKKDGKLDLEATADDLSRQIRAFDPWPGTFILWDDRSLAIKRAHATSHNGEIIAGQVVLIDNAPALTTHEGFLVLDEVQPAGKREMPGEAFIRGAPDFIGAKLLN
ncbi:MAG: methionyl-tRNA formyltransferase [Anaerolineales bacterium]